MYRTLELWLQVAGASSSVLQGSPNHSEILFSHLLSDITPGAESVKVWTPGRAPHTAWRGALHLEHGFQRFKKLNNTQYSVHVA